MGDAVLRRYRARGFTLLEVLVVLVLLALLTGLTAPAMVRAADAARLRGVRTDLIAVIEALPLQAFSQGRRLEVGAVDLTARLADWPADWQLQTDQALRYSAAGVAEGAVLVLRQGGSAGAPAWRLTVAPITGEVHAD